MRNQSNRGSQCLRAGAVLGLAAVLMAGCADSTIHKQANIGGVDTLSLDAKQRLMLVGTRPDGYRVTCTEPSPDALVARAAVPAASGPVNNPTSIGGSGGVSGGSTESAGSIGFRDHTIQMLRDGYFRLCEAYMNGALTPRQYEHMITNADTFMVVVSALQVLGSNPVAPALAIQAGSVSGAAPRDGTPSAQITQSGPGIAIGTVAGSNMSAENAKVAAQIVRDYLRYRAALARYQDQKDAHVRVLTREK